MSSCFFLPPSIRILCIASLGAGLVLTGTDSARAQSAAASNSVDLPELVVSATGTPTPGREVASSVTVITADDIANTQELSLIHI